MLLADNFLNSYSAIAAGCLVVAGSALAYVCYRYYDTSTAVSKVDTCTAVSTTTVGTQMYPDSPEAQCMEVAQAVSGREAIDIASKVVNPISYESIYYLVMDQVESYVNGLLQDYNFDASTQLVAFYAQFGGITTFYTDLTEAYQVTVSPVILPLIFAKTVTGTMSPEATLEGFQTFLHGCLKYNFNTSLVAALCHRGMSHDTILTFLTELGSKVEKSQLEEISRIFSDLARNKRL